MSRGLAAGRRALLSLLCLAFAAWAVDPDLAHLPKVVSVLEDHARMVAEHGSVRPSVYEAAGPC